MSEDRSEVGLRDNGSEQRLALLGRLHASVTHEINNLMVGVLGYADVELSRARDAESAQNLRHIVDCAAAVRDLTRTLLRLSRAPDSHGGFGDVSQAVQSTLDLFQRRARGVDVSSHVPEGIGKVTLGTRDLQLILANLIQNALDAMEQSTSPSLCVRVSEEPEFLVLDVWNSGPPIPEADLPKLLEPFFTTKSEARGTGLGLSIVHRLVTLSGGSLRVENAENGGVRVRLTLEKARPLEATEQATPATRPAPIRGRRVLVVDDERTAREVLRLMASQMGGAVVDTCCNGSEALERLSRERFDAIVLDLRMAGLSGQEVFRSLPPNLQRRVVFVTGDTLRASTRDFLSSTHQPALFKPVHWRELLEAVGRVAA